MDDNALIRIRHVRKVYLMGEEKVVALDDVSLDIYKGEFVCFLGTSGSGKSTFLNMVAGLEKPTKGEIWIGKVPIHKLNEAQVTIFRQKNIGFIFQAYHLMQSMTALENVALPLMLKGVPKEIREPAAKKALAQVGLKGYEGRKPNQMSGGQQQRVGIARAFVARPDVVFADEPTGNLDSKTTIEVMELIKEMAAKHNQTIVMVTHDVSLAAYADKIIHIKDGIIESIEQNQNVKQVTKGTDQQIGGNSNENS